MRVELKERLRAKTALVIDFVDARLEVGGADRAEGPSKSLVICHDGAAEIENIHCSGALPLASVSRTWRVEEAFFRAESAAFRRKLQSGARFVASPVPVPVSRGRTARAHDLDEVRASGSPAARVILERRRGRRELLGRACPARS